MSVEDVAEAAYRRSIRNRLILQLSEFAGCFQCLEIFPANHVGMFVAEEDESLSSQSGLCPKCDAVTVLPDMTGPISKDFLQLVNRYWYDPHD